MLLSALTPQHLDIYRMTVELMDGYFPTLDQIKKVVAPDGFSEELSSHFSHIFTKILRTLNSELIISKIYESLRSENLETRRTVINKAKKAILRSIKNGESIGTGSARIIANKARINYETVSFVLKKLKRIFS